MIYLPNKGKRGRMFIGFLPNKESIRGTRTNPMHFYSLRELASEHPSESGRNVGTLHLRKPLPLPRRCLAPLLQRNRRRQQDLAGESWLAECAPNGIGGGGSQAGSEESDGGTARWIGDQLRQN